MLKKTPNLRHVSVTNIRERTHFFWGQGEFSLQPALLQLYQAANSNLKPFTLCNITPSSKVLVTAAFFLKSIRELTLHGTSPGCEDVTLFAPGKFDGLADLTKLEMTGVSLRSTYQYLGTPTT